MLAFFLSQKLLTNSHNTCSVNGFVKKQANIQDSRDTLGLEEDHRVPITLNWNL